MTLVYTAAVAVLIVIGWLYVTRTQSTLISNEERKELDKTRFEKR